MNSYTIESDIVYQEQLQECLAVTLHMHHKSGPVEEVMNAVLYMYALQ